jgi:hypothetical protein
MTSARAADLLGAIRRRRREQEMTEATQRRPDTDSSEERRSAFAALFGADGPPDFDDLSGPLHWEDLTPGEAGVAWPELRCWVEHLVVRFSHLDHHVIPACWWRHNGHVEALAALRDHERVSYAETAPATAAVEWHRALRDIEAMLRDWTGQHGCGAAHNDRDRQLRPPGPVEWDQFVRTDLESRQRAAIDAALSTEAPAP